MNPNVISRCPIDHLARKEALEVYKKPLGEIALTACSDQSSVNDEFLLANTDRPVFYGLLGKAITQIIDTKPAEDDVVDTKKGITKTRKWLLGSNNTQVESLALNLSADLRAKVKAFLNNPMNDQLVSVLDSVMQSKKRLNGDGWGDIYLALNAGMGTMITSSCWLIKGYIELADNLGIEQEAREKLFEKSYGPLIQLAQISSLQLMAVNRLIDDDQVPGFALTKNQNTIKFQTKIENWPLTTVVVDKINEFFDQKPKIQTVGEIENGRPIIGCPVLFGPNQTKNFWLYTIDKAEGLELI